MFPSEVSSLYKNDFCQFLFPSCTFCFSTCKSFSPPCHTLPRASSQLVTALLLGEFGSARRQRQVWVVILAFRSFFGLTFFGLASLYRLPNGPVPRPNPAFDFPFSILLFLLPPEKPPPSFPSFISAIDFAFCCPEIYFV